MKEKNYFKELTLETAFETFLRIKFFEDLKVFF